MPLTPLSSAPIFGGRIIRMFAVIHEYTLD